VPPLLKLFLKQLISNPLKQVSFGQGIVQATKPNACIMPIMFGLGLQIDRLGLRDLQDEVAHLGFCMSNAEVRHFKLSLMSNDDMESSAETKQSVPFHSHSLLPIILTTMSEHCVVDLEHFTEWAQLQPQSAMGLLAHWNAGE